MVLFFRGSKYIKESNYSVYEKIIISILLREIKRDFENVKKLEFN